jgi:FkbM family methyltransferase
MSSTAFLLENLFAKSIAFEPAPGNFHLLQENTKLNGLQEKLISFNIALSNKDSEIELEISDKNYGDNRVRSLQVNENENFSESSRRVVKISSRRLDGFLVDHQEILKSKIQLIWMDIQGHEPLFVEGAENFLSQYRVPIFMEFWPYGMRRSGADLDRFFQFMIATYTSFVDFGDGNKIRYDISQIKNFFCQLELKSEECKDPGLGTNLLFL